MGCFSYLCTECGSPINSSSFHGENARLSLLEKGKVIESMQGQYDSYGRTFNENMESDEWKSKEWGDIVDMHFDGNPLNGISAAHTFCIKKNPNYKAVQASEDDPDQGWGRIKSYHSGKCEVFHKISVINSDFFEGESAEEECEIVEFIDDKTCIVKLSSDPSIKCKVELKDGRWKIIENVEE